MLFILLQFFITEMQVKYLIVKFFYNNLQRLIIEFASCQLEKGDFEIFFLFVIFQTMLHPMPVQNMLLYPSHEYAQYEQTAGASASYGGGNSLQQNAAMVLSSLGVGGAGAGSSAAGNNAVEPSYPLFSLRPLIDSIFEVSARIYNRLARPQCHWRSVWALGCGLVTAKTQNPLRTNSNFDA